ncbi:hypothetical protein MASR2M79_02110 [Aminivibrio sp.]
MTMKKRIFSLLCALAALFLPFAAKGPEGVTFFMTPPAYSGNQEPAKFPLKTGAALPTIGTVTGTRVNLRAEPSLSSAVVLRFEGGELVEVLEKAPEKSGEGYPWYSVTTGDGSKGWMYGQFLAVDMIPPKFALAAPDGLQVILLHGGDGRPLMKKAAHRFTHCIFDGVLHPVVYGEYQEQGAEWNGRETEQHFGDLGGFLFRVEGSPLSLPSGDFGGSDALLVDDEYANAAGIVPLKKKPAKVSPDLRKEFEKRYGRTLKTMIRIAGADSGVAVCAMEFKPRGKSALGVVALVVPEGTCCLDFPAHYDGQSTWSVDDEGNFYPEYYTVGSLMKLDDRYELTLHKPAAESASSRLVVTKGEKLVEQAGSSSYRYISPE